MSNDRHDPQRRILDEFGAADEIVGIDIDYSLADLKLFLPALAVALLLVAVASRLGGTWATLGGLGAALVVLLLTGAVVFVAPAHMTPQQWLGRIAAFTRRERTRTAVGATATDRSGRLTQVARFIPEADALERRDGQLVAAIRIDPANMALATHEEWNAAADALGDALNTLDFPIQLHSSARSVDPDRLTAGYRARRDDPDVLANESLAEIIDIYERRLPAEFRSRGTSIRTYHVLVPVGVREVQLADRGAVAKLTSLPYVGGLLAILGAESSGLSAAEITQRQRETLDTRLTDVRSAIRSVEGCDCTVVSADRLASLLEEFWTGRRTEYDDTRDRVRSVSVVTAGDASGRA
jgi:hypothetical protein